MDHLDLTLATPAENLALDEALWEACEAGGPEVLRFWESPVHFVVLGYANRIASEVRLALCQQRRLPVLRRVTGGGAVLQGPGCLNYALVLRIAATGPTASIPATNLHLMNRHAAALTRALGLPVRRRGDTDLAIGDRKFSGNAQRRGRHALLFHGTFLLRLDFEIAQAVLPAPSRQPDYRRDRGHAEFLMNLVADPATVQAAILQAWGLEPPSGPGPLASTAGTGPRPAVPADPERSGHHARQGPAERTDLPALIARARELAAQKYTTPTWNRRF